jgi:hypothetical protein
VHLPLSAQNLERLIDVLDQLEIAACGPACLGRAGLAQNGYFGLADCGHVVPSLSAVALWEDRLLQSSLPLGAHDGICGFPSYAEGTAAGFDQV